MSEKDSVDRVAINPEFSVKLPKPGRLKGLKKLACKKMARRGHGLEASPLKPGSLSAVHARSCESQAPVMIDPLEQRLLYSADHPLGLALSAADLHDEFAQFDDVQLVSALLDELRQQPLTDAATPRMLDGGSTGTEEILVTTFVDNLDAADMSSLESFNADVGADGKVSLREAIQVANSDASVGKITLQDGTYTLTLNGSSPSEDRNLNGDLDLTGTFTIQGVSEGNTVINQSVDGNRVFEVRSGEVSFADLEISGFVDGGGNATIGSSGAAAFIHSSAIANFNDVALSRNMSNAEGGALYVAGEAHLVNVTISGNQADAVGGGIYIAENGSASLTGVDSSIEGNTSFVGGGGIYSDGILDMQGGGITGNGVINEIPDNLPRGGGLYISSTGKADLREVGISGNSAESGGAGIFTEGQLTLTDSSVSGHGFSAIGDTSSSISGAGIYIDGTGSGILTRVEVTGNTATELGGGIYNAGTLETLDVSLNNNRAAQGGGIYSEGVLQMLQSSLSNNDAAAGGGIYNNGAAKLTDVDFLQNRAAQGGGIYNEGGLDVPENNPDIPQDGLILINASIDKNEATQGGGIYSIGGLYVDNTVFDSNSVSSESDINQSRGGGAYIGGGRAEILNSRFSNNAAPSSGAGIYTEAALELLDSTLVANLAGATGGGLANAGSGVATLERVTIWGNESQGTLTSSGGGGGVYNGPDAMLAVSYSVVANNKSNQLTAGILSLGDAVIDSSRILSNATIAGSTSAGIGTGLESLPGNTLSITNSVVANNTSDGESNDVSGFGTIISSGGFNLIETADNPDVQGTDIIGLDAGFGATPTDAAPDGELDPGSIYLIDNQVQYVIDDNSPTLYSGGATAASDTTIGGSPVGVLPHIGGYSYSVTNGKVFWTSADGNIYRSDTQFAFSQLIVETAAQSLDIEVDVQAGRIYWLDQLSNAIMGANFDGSDIQTVQQVDINAVEIVLDKKHDRFFTLVNGDSSSIVQYFFSLTPGSEVTEPRTEVVYTSDNILNALELDQIDDVLYWAEAGGTDIARVASLQTQPFGTNPQVSVVQTLVNDPTVVNNPSSITIIDSADQVFWAEPDSQELIRSDEHATPQTLRYEYTTSPVPQSIEYDNVDDRILVAGQQESVYVINAELEESLLLGTVPEPVADMAYAFIEAVTDTSIEQSPAIIINDGLTVQKGQSITLSSEFLSITDADTPADKIVYTLDSQVSDITVYRNLAQVTRFTQNDIDLDRISIEHSGRHIGTGTMWDITLPFTVSVDTEQPQSVPFVVTVNGINEPPVYDAIPLLTVQEGATLPLDNTVLPVSDVDTDDADVIFVIRGQAGGEVLAGDSALGLQDTFTLEQLKSGAVEYRHTGDERLLVESYIELAIRDQNSEPVNIPRIAIDVIPVNDNVPIAQNLVATGKHNTTITTVVSADRGVTADEVPASTLLYGVVDADLPDDSFTVIVDDTALQYGTLSANEDGSFAYTPRADLERDIEYEDTFQYQIVDGVGHESDAATVTIVVQALERPQVAGMLEDQVAEDGDYFELTLPETLFSSPEGEQAQPFSWQVVLSNSSARPPWLMFDESTLTLSGTPGDEDTGLLDLEVIVTDSNGLVSAPLSLIIDVQNINQAPQITGNSLSAIPENNAGAVSGQVQATDPDSSDTLLYSVDDTRFEFAGDTLKLKDSESLDHEVESSIRLIVQVSDGNGLSDSQPVNIDVLDENDSPPVDVSLGEQGPVEQGLVEQGPVEQGPVEQGPVEQGPVEQGPEEQGPVEQGPVEPGPVEPGPVEQGPEEQEPEELGPEELGPVEQEPGEQGLEEQGLEEQEPEEQGLEELPETEVTEEIDSGIVEPSLGEVSSLDETIPGANDIIPEFVTPTALPPLQASASISTVSNTAFSELIEGQLEQDGSEVVSSLATNTLLSVFDNDELDSFMALVLRDNVLSEHLASQRPDLSKNLQSRAIPDLFEQSIDIAELFASAQARDSDMYALLIEDFEKRQRDVEVSIATSRAVVGSSLALTTGITVGYFIYLLRSGALMASMLTSLPAWRFVDPLPILGHLDGSDGEDAESLQTIVSGENSGRASLGKKMPPHTEPY